MGILSGLDSLGLGNLEQLEKNTLFEESNEQEDTDRDSGEPAEKKVNEAEFLFEKSYTCPVCDHTFKNKTVRSGKTHFTGTDLDLRPKYMPLDILKYDIVFCPTCGYAALSRYFPNIAKPQAKLLLESITPNFKFQQPEDETMVTYDDAIMRHQMALAGAIVKKARVSERAYTCLKMAWVIRGKLESMDSIAPDYEEQRERLSSMEEEALQNALDGFVSAVQTESLPICGMDGDTVDYLISTLYFHFEQYEAAAKLVSKLLVSRTTNSRMKDKARMLKDMIRDALKNR